MAIIYYDHLFSKSQIKEILDQLQDAENYKNKLHQLVDDIIFQGITVMLLKQLAETKHKIFLEMVHERPYDPEIIIFLREHTHSKIEEDIKKEAEKLLGMVMKDMVP